jgi:dienelactone hydrolase
MKSRYFGMAVVAISTFAFVNCGNESSPIDPNVIGELLSSSSEEVIVPPLSSGSELPFDVSSSSGDAFYSSSEEFPLSSGEIPLSSEGVVVSSSSEVMGVSSSFEVVSSSSEVPVSSSSEVVVPTGIYLANDTDENKNYMQVEYKINTGFDGGGILAYPKNLSTTQKHGIVVWGPGGGTEPSAYEGIIRRLASHGFVVIALKESPGDASQAKAAIDWLENKNNTATDPFYQKLDMSKVGCSGHSMGGLESEQALIQDSRVITAIMNNSGDLGHTAMSKVSPQKTIAIVYGEGGMERPNAVADYNNAGVKAPACLIKMTGGQSAEGQGTECAADYQGGPQECGWGHGSGSWGGMAATVAWMRWHLGGEDFRKADFVGSNGAYINGPIIGEQGHWKGTCKNF